jgi:hypothetical protein
VSEDILGDGGILPVQFPAESTPSPVWFERFVELVVGPFTQHVENLSG